MQRPFNTSHLDKLVDALQAATRWLDIGEYEAICRASDDAFDAVIASLTARAAVCSHTVAPTADEAKMAAREGWFALPVDASLGLLIEQG